MLREQIDAEVKKAEDRIQSALQDLHKATGLVPVAVSFEAIDTRSLEDMSKHQKHIVISNIEVIANT